MWSNCSVSSKRECLVMTGFGLVSATRIQKFLSDRGIHSFADGYTRGGKPLDATFRLHGRRHCGRRLGSHSRADTESVCARVVEHAGAIREQRSCDDRIYLRSMITAAGPFAFTE